MENQTEQQTENIIVAPTTKHEVVPSAETIFHIGRMPVTNSMLTSSLAVFVIVILAIVVRKNIKSVPNKLQLAFETLIEGGLSLCDQVTNDRKISLKVFPIGVCVFVFICA